MRFSIEMVAIYRPIATTNGFDRIGAFFHPADASFGVRDVILDRRYLIGGWTIIEHQ